MTELIQTPAASFAGKVFTTEDLDELNTFAQCWRDFEAAGYWPQLDALTDTPNRSYLLVFSPYGAFQYWVGALLPAMAQVPAGLTNFKLPAATVASTSEKTNRLLADMPVEVSYMKGMAELESAGFPLPEHIGQTDWPYYVESFAVNSATITHRLYVNPDQLEGYDEYD
ncbi:hypothetical protein [Lacticaseibacillus nasuensis]|nr:hypothetical protein [Lacticaseibacillus nasuensis]